MSGRLLLAIDTSFGPVSAALLAGDGGELAVLRVADAAGQQAEVLPPLVAELFLSCRADVAALGRVVVTTGPGAFTGVRVGIAFAKGLRLATGAEVLGVSTLECLAVQAQTLRPGACVGIVLDAKRDEVYAHAKGADGSHLLAPGLFSIADAGPILSRACDPTLALVGSGRDLVSAPGAERPSADIGEVDVRVLARLGAKASAADHPLTPCYLRAPDARLPA